MKVIQNILLNKEFGLLSFENQGNFKKTIPGQFLTIGIPEENIPFLKKPFSIYDIVNDKIFILYRIVGKGTKRISKLKIGDEINVMGPLGNGLDEKISTPVALIAGGVGIASLRLIGKNLNDKADLFYGVATKSEIIDLDSWKKIVKNINISSDDGSYGEKGFITDLFNKIVTNYKTIIACGPKPMLKTVSDICKKIGLKHYLIMEEYMGCGIGVCQGCVVNTVDGYKRACKEGPVFDGEKLIW